MYFDHPFFVKFFSERGIKCVVRIYSSLKIICVLLLKFVDMRILIFAQSK